MSNSIFLDFSSKSYPGSTLWNFEFAIFSFLEVGGVKIWPILLKFGLELSFSIFDQIKTREM